MSRTYLSGNALPTVIIVSILILTMLFGLLILWGHESLLYAREQHLRQCRADVESAFTLYANASDRGLVLSPNGYQLYDSLPKSRVLLHAQSWGLYEVVRVHSTSKTVQACRLFGAKINSDQTLYLADNGAAITLSGHTHIQGQLQLPRNGIIYGRMGAKFYDGEEISPAAIKASIATLPTPNPEVVSCLEIQFNTQRNTSSIRLPNTLHCSFFTDSIMQISLGQAKIQYCSLTGQIILFADELHIDSTCHIKHLQIYAKKITIGRGTRITAQCFARDSIILEPRAAMQYPSGVYAEKYIEVGDNAQLDGFVIIRDTLHRNKNGVNYRQSRTARVRGLIWVDGMAQLQGVIAGYAAIQQTAFFSPQGYYKEMINDLTVLENPHTIHPLWLSQHRNEVICVD